MIFLWGGGGGGGGGWLCYICVNFCNHTHFCYMYNHTQFIMSGHSDKFLVVRCYSSNEEMNSKLIKIDIVAT